MSLRVSPQGVHLALQSAILLWPYCLQMPCNCKSTGPRLEHRLQKGLLDAVLSHGQDRLNCCGLAVHLLSQKETAALLSWVLADTLVWNPEQKPSLSMQCVLRVACKLYNSAQEAWKVQRPACDSAAKWRCFWRKESPSWAPDGMIEGKQAITGKAAKCCLGLGQVPVVQAYLSQYSADTSKKQSLRSDAHSKNIVSLSWQCNQILLQRLYWNIRV